jgi:hypothetical protein
MKTIATFLLLVCCNLCLAADESNIIVATDWSQPVESNGSYIRGRLLIVKGSEHAYDGPYTNNSTMTFVELENVTGACCGSSKIYFDVMGLNCELFDTNGAPVPLARSFGGGGRGNNFGSTWAVLPYNSSTRLYVNGGSESPFSILQNVSHHWEIQPSDTNAYYLFGTLTISTPTTNANLTVTPDKGMHYYAGWSGTLTFPKVKILFPKP